MCSLFGGPVLSQFPFLFMSVGHVGSKPFLSAPSPPSLVRLVSLSLASLLLSWSFGRPDRHLLMLAARCKAALVQMTAVNDLATNLASCVRYVREARSQGCSMVFFPENFSFMGSRPGEAQTIAEPLDGPVMRSYLDLARDEGVWLSLGGFQEKGPEDDPRIYNTHVIVDADGQIVASYRKIHLYDAPFVGLVESRQALPGEKLVVADSPAGRLGVTICYDMRFPELYQKLTFLHGAQVRRCSYTRAHRRKISRSLKIHLP